MENSSSKIVIMWIVLALIVGTVGGYYIGKSSEKSGGYAQPVPSIGINAKQVAFKLAMRKLWEDHITWTQLAVISLINGSQDTDKTLERLLKNYDDFEDALKPYYGNDAAEKFGDLLKDHLNIAVELVKAAKAGDSVKAGDAEKRWYANTDEIAAFLADANPNWPKHTLIVMLYDHLKMTKDGAVDRLTKNYKAAIAAYDNIHDQSSAYDGGYTFRRNH